MGCRTALARHHRGRIPSSSRRIDARTAEPRRLQLLDMAVEGKLTLVSAAEKLGLSYRQAKRLKHGLEMKAPEALRFGGRAEEEIEAEQGKTPYEALRSLLAST